MKNFKFLSLLWVSLLAAFLAAWCTKNNNEAVSNEENSDFIIEEISTDAVIAYHDNLIDIASECLMAEYDVRNVYSNEEASLDDLSSAIDSTIAKCSDSSNRIKKEWDWEGDSSLKDGLVNLMDKYIKYFNKFAEILPYLGLDDPTENEEFAAIENEIDLLGGEIDEAIENITSVQEEFARSHWFNLEEIDTEETDESAAE